MKVVWRFNVIEGVDPDRVVDWLTSKVFPSGEKYGGVLKLYRVEQGAHAWSIEGTWPSADARERWQASDDYARLPNWPGSDSPWGAASDLDVAIYHDVPLP